MSNNVPSAQPGDPGRPFQAYASQGARGQPDSTYQNQYALIPAGPRNPSFRVAAPVPRNIAHIYRGAEGELGDAYQRTPMLGGTTGNIGYHQMSGNFHTIAQVSNNAGYAFQGTGGQADNTYQPNPMLGGVSGHIQGVYAGTSSGSVNRDVNWTMKGTGNFTGASIYILCRPRSNNIFSGAGESGGAYPVMSGTTAQSLQFGLKYQGMSSGHMKYPGMN